MSTCPKCGTRFTSNERLCPHDGSVLEAEGAVEERQLGRTLDGKYRLEAYLSRGGMGAVYRATHVMLGKPVAVKLIQPELVATPEIVRRFQREARAATHLNHPNIVSVYDLGQAEDGTLYIAMELVNGPTLKEVIRKGGALDPARTVKLLRQVVSALALAHRSSVIHRDLKPQNIMLARDAEGHEAAKLVDFGIAKTFEVDAETQLTAAGFALGTPHYMSPEQAAGKEIDARTDLYSLGVILYEMLTGDVPFNDPSTPAILIKHISEVPTPPSRRRPDLGIRPDLEAIALRCLEKDPTKRFASAEDLGQALDHIRVTGVAASAEVANDVLLATMPVRRSGPTPAGTPVSAPPPVPAPIPAASREDVRTDPTRASRAPVSAPAPAPTPAPVSGPANFGLPPPVPPRADSPATTKDRRPPVLVLAAVAIVLVLAGVVFAAVQFGLFESSAESPGPAVTDSALNPAPEAPAPSTPAPTEPASSPPSPPAGENRAATNPRPAPPAAGAPVEAPPPARNAAGASGGAARGQDAAPPAQAAERVVQSAPAQTPPPQPSVPEVPTVLLNCEGAAEVCGALRQAFDEAFQKAGFGTTRTPARADIVLAAAASILEERVEQQFGTTFAVRTYSVELDGQAVRVGADVPGLGSSTFSTDLRFGRERIAEQARLLAASSVERVRAFWKAQQP